MFFFNPLEQFLLIQTDAGFIWSIIFSLPLEIYSNYSMETLILIYNILIYETFLIHFNNFNLSFSLVNLQYYKLSFFLILLLTAFSIYKSNIFPKTLWQFFSQQSHIIAQSVLKPTFGSHYPFEVRFYIIIHFYIIFFYLYYVIIY